MLIASTVGEDGRKVLVLGLEQGNIDHLLNDKPIYKDLKIEGVPGLEAWDVYILGPEDTVRFTAHFRLGERPPIR